MQNNLDDFYIVSLRPVYTCLHRIANIRRNGIIICHFLVARNLLILKLFLLPLPAIRRHIAECQCCLSVIRFYFVVESQRLCTHRIKFNKSIFIFYVLFQNSLTVFGGRCCCNSGCNRRFCCGNWCFCCGCYTCCSSGSCCNRRILANCKGYRDGISGSYCFASKCSSIHGNYSSPGVLFVAVRHVLIIFIYSASDISICFTTCRERYRIYFQIVCKVLFVLVFENNKVKLLQIAGSKRGGVLCGYGISTVSCYVADLCCKGVIVLTTQCPVLISRKQIAVTSCACTCSQ